MYMVSPSDVASVREKLMVAAVQEGVVVVVFVVKVAELDEKPRT